MFKTKKRVAREKARRVAAHNELTWRAPMSELIDAEGNLRLESPIGDTVIRTIALINVPSAKSFESTSASQWSTADVAVTKQTRLAKALQRTVYVQRDKTTGRIVGIRFNPIEAKEQVRHWKWLVQHPGLTYNLVKQAHRASQRRKNALADSALFL